MRDRDLCRLAEPRAMNQRAQCLMGSGALEDDCLIWRTGIGNGNVKSDSEQKVLFLREAS